MPRKILVTLLLTAAATVVSCDTQSRISNRASGDACEEMIREAGLNWAHCGILAVDLRTGRTVLECNSTRLFIPASTLKLLTTYVTSLEFDPGFRFETRLWAGRSSTDHSRASKLVLQGGGDPFLLDGAWDDDQPPEWGTLIADMSAAGIRAVDGPVIGDGSLYGRCMVPRFWESLDLDLYHGPPVSSLNTGHNVFRVIIAAGRGIGLPARIETRPDLGDFYRIANHVETSHGRVTEISVRRSRIDGSLDLTGVIGVGADSVVRFCTVSDPPRFAASWLCKTMESSAIDIVGGDSAAYEPAIEPGMELIGTIQSESLIEIIHRTNKQSDNLGAECLLRMLATSDGTFESDSAAIDRILAILTERGLPTDPPVRMVDGSGLSRTNLLAPAHLVWLLADAADNERARPWIQSLALSGTDPTLGGHPVSDRLPGKILAKTGSMSSVRCIAGYYLDGRGDPMFAFAVMTNALSEDNESAIELERLVIYQLRQLAILSELDDLDL